MAQEFSCTPPEIREIAASTLNSLLPKKSQKAYDKEYAKFDVWCTENGVGTISENVLLAYFQKESQVMKPSSLWSKYSMIKACLNIYKNIDISKYFKLIAFLKRLSEHQAKKSKILDIDNIHRFINEAYDNMYLVYKIILIMGYSGACRREEITNMNLQDIVFKDDAIVVHIPKTKTYVQKKFIITEKMWINLVMKYQSLRPSSATHQLFFLTYRNGYCINSPIGINTIGKAPKIIATFLNSGSDLVTIKKHGGWKSSAVAEGYIDASTQKKVEIGNILSNNPRIPCTVTSNAASCSINEENNVEQQFVSLATQNLPGISINAQDTSSVTVNVYNNCTINNKQ